MKNSRDYDISSPPPESWLPARRFALKMVGPVERFMEVEASSGIALLAAAIVALVWANSPLGESYDHLWHTPFMFGIGSWSFEGSLHFWINDFLMAIFFFVVGLEIKREIMEGALSDIRQAALPIAAAIGGMLVPAAIFLALNPTGPTRDAWGVPMATDIAFAVGVLTLLGKRVPTALRILLLALAIIDDIGAILVIALFYSSGLQLEALLVVAAGIAGILLFTWIGVRPGLLWAFPPLVVWAGTLQLGVHPTIAGVVVGLMVPMRSWFSREKFLSVARSALDEFQARAANQDDDKKLVEPLNTLARARREALSPAKRLEMALHPWVAFTIMPLFALANAGVRLSGLSLGEAGAMSVVLGIGMGLVVGKPLGIVGASWLTARLGLCRLPSGVSWGGLFVAGSAAGIGFTMAIFIAELAFSGDPLLGVGKLAVLIGTAVAVGMTFVAGLLLLPKERPEAMTEMTASEIESSVAYWTREGVTPPRHSGINVKM